MGRFTRLDSCCTVQSITNFKDLQHLEGERTRRIVLESDGPKANVKFIQDLCSGECSELAMTVRNVFEASTKYLERRGTIFRLWVFVALHSCTSSRGSLRFEKVII